MHPANLYRPVFSGNRAVVVWVYRKMRKPCPTGRSQRCSVRLQ